MRQSLREVRGRDIASKGPDATHDNNVTTPAPRATHDATAQPTNHIQAKKPAHGTQSGTNNALQSEHPSGPQSPRHVSKPPSANLPALARNHSPSTRESLPALRGPAHQSFANRLPTRAHTAAHRSAAAANPAQCARACASAEYRRRSSPNRAHEYVLVSSAGPAHEPDAHFVDERARRAAHAEIAAAVSLAEDAFDFPHAA